MRSEHHVPCAVGATKCLAPRRLASVWRARRRACRDHAAGCSSRCSDRSPQRSPCAAPAPTPAPAHPRWTRTWSAQAPAARWSLRRCCRRHRRWWWWWWWCRRRHAAQGARQARPRSTGRRMGSAPATQPPWCAKGARGHQSPRPTGTRSTWSGGRAKGHQHPSAVQFERRILLPPRARQAASALGSRKHQGYETTTRSCGTNDPPPPERGEAR